MPAPSLILVPTRFTTGKLYTPLATTSDGTVLGASGDFNVTRATTATRVNASGLIELVASGIPRLDYLASGGTVGCPALLVEPSAQNLVLQSSDYLVSPTWLLSNLNSTSGITSPSGTNDALLLEATTTSPRLRQNITLTSGTTYTFSWFGKFGSISSGFAMNVFDENSTSYGSGVCQAFNLNEGTLGASGTVGAGFTLQSAGMENYGNGWYRCRMTVLMGYTPATPRVGMRIGTQISGGRPLGVLSGTVNLWGAQLEVGSVATSYIPTTTAAVTRNADVVAVSGAVSGAIGQTEGTIYAEVDMRNLGTSVSIMNVQTTSYVSGTVRIETTASNQLRIQIRDASGTSRLDNTITTPTISAGINKIAVGYSSDASGVVTALNGTIINTTTVSASFGTLGANRVYLGTRETAGFQDLFFNNRIRPTALYTTRLTNAQLQALTT